MKKKRLDQDAYNLTKKYHEEGLGYKEIAAILAEGGYVKPTGGWVNRFDLANFMRKCGYVSKERPDVTHASDTTNYSMGSQLSEDQEDPTETEQEEEVTEDYIDEEPAEFAGFNDPKLQATLELINSGKFTEPQLLALIKAVTNSEAEPEAPAHTGETH